MYVDALAVFIFIVLTGLGWWSGAFIQLSRLVVLGVIVFCAPTVNQFVLPVVERVTGGGELIAVPISYLLTTLGIYVGLSLLTNFFRWVLLKQSDSLHKLDQMGGIVLGGLKAVGIIYFFVSFVVAFEPLLKDLDPDNYLRYQNSQLVDKYQKCKCLSPWQLVYLIDLKHALEVGYRRASGDSDRMAEMSEAIQSFFDDSKVDALLGNSEVRRILKEGGSWELLLEPDIRSFLQQPEHLRQLEKYDWSEILETLNQSESESKD